MRHDPGGGPGEPRPCETERPGSQQWDTARQRLLELREPASALERRALTLSAQMAGISESRQCGMAEGRVLFVAADRLRELARIIVGIDWSRGGPETGRLLEELIWRMNLLAMECAASLPEESNASRELASLAHEARTMAANWRTLAADLAFAGGEDRRRSRLASGLRRRAE